MLTSRHVRSAIVALGLLGAASSPAFAEPALQLYIEGATYDQADETWVYTGGPSFTLWVIGNTQQYPAINDVKLAGAVATSEVGGGAGVALTPTTAAALTDPSTPSAPSAPTLFGDGSIPVLADGSPLPAHGVYGAGTSYYEWGLGNFTLGDSPVGDFIDTFPTSFPKTGQINAYEVTVTGFTTVHFDAYGSTGSGGQLRVRFAPFSHDAVAKGENPVPEPATLVLLGTGLAGLGVRRRLRRRQS